MQCHDGQAAKQLCRYVTDGTSDSSSRPRRSPSRVDRQPCSKPLTSDSSAIGWSPNSVTGTPASRQIRRRSGTEKTPPARELSPRTTGGKYSCGRASLSVTRARQSRRLPGRRRSCVQRSRLLSRETVSTGVSIVLVETDRTRPSHRPLSVIAGLIRFPPDRSLDPREMLVINHITLYQMGSHRHRRFQGVDQFRITVGLWPSLGSCIDIEAF